MGRLDLRDPWRDEDGPHPSEEGQWDSPTPRRPAHLGLSDEHRELLAEVLERHGLTREVPAGVNPFAPAPYPINSELSVREVEVLTHVAGGLTNDEIAVKLFLSVETVKSHMRHIHKKYGAQNRAHAVALAYERGVIPLGTLV